MLAHIGKVTKRKMTALVSVAFTAGVIVGCVVFYLVTESSIKPDMAKQPGLTDAQHSLDRIGASNLDSTTDQLLLLQKLHAELNALRDENRDLKSTLEEKRKDTIEDYGLDADYVHTLKHKSMSENLLITAEGQIKHQLTVGQVRKINQAMKDFRDMLRLYEKENATVVEQSDNQIELKIPAFPEEQSLRDDVLEALVNIVGEDKGQSIFNESQHVFSKALMGFGSHHRIITVSGLEEPIANIQDKHFDDTGSPFTSSWRSPLNEIPVQFRHLMQLNHE